MRDFFDRQEAARRRSGRLVLLFALAVLGVVAAVYLAVAGLRFWFWTGPDVIGGLWHPQLFGWTTAGTLLFIALGSLYKISTLREGGRRVAEILGARPVPPGTAEPSERRLRNVVEEMAIASGVPVPEVYLLERERGINAFAAGYGPEDAVVCVTRGALELLKRDELQGVVAHEFSQILNGDMRLNLHLLGWLHGILLLSLLGEAVLRGMRRARGKGAGAIALLAIALYVVGYIGYFFGRLIQCAVSRQREYLGDASAVQFTRNPQGLAGALKKVGGLAEGSRLDHPHAAELSHMYFGNGLAAAWWHALDSHPPLAERIRLLDPAFRGDFPEVRALEPPPLAPLVAALRPARPAPPAPEPIVSGAEVAALLASVGAPMREHAELARQLLAGLPEPLRLAARDSFGASALVYGLLLDRDPALRARQQELLAARENPAVAGEVQRLAPLLAGLDPRARLLLVDLSLPSLRCLSSDQYLRLSEVFEALAAADRKVSLFEFALRHLLRRHLEPRFVGRPAKVAQVYAIRGVQRECSLILSALARVGQRDEAQAQQAFARGQLVLHAPKAEFAFLPAAECGPAALDQALVALDATSPLIKRRLLAGCLECLAHDGRVTAAEVELFRAVADALGCPVPPWLGQASSSELNAVSP